MTWADFYLVWFAVASFSVCFRSCWAECAFICRMEWEARTATYLQRRMAVRCAPAA